MAQGPRERAAAAQFGRRPTAPARTPQSRRPRRRPGPWPRWRSRCSGRPGTGRLRRPDPQVGQARARAAPLDRLGAAPASARGGREVGRRVWRAAVGVGRQAGAALGEGCPQGRPEEGRQGEAFRAGCVPQGVRPVRVVRVGRPLHRQEHDDGEQVRKVRRPLPAPGAPPRHQHADQVHVSGRPGRSPAKRRPPPPSASNGTRTTSRPSSTPSPPPGAASSPSRASGSRSRSGSSSTRSRSRSTSPPTTPTTTSAPTSTGRRRTPPTSPTRRSWRCSREARS